MVLTKSELEVMNVLWRENRPLSRNDIIYLSENKSWKDSSIHILLNGLLKKEAISEAGFAKFGKTYGRLFEANISCEDYYAETVFAAVGEENLLLLFAAMIRNDKITPEILSKLESILAERKAELNKSKCDAVDFNYFLSELKKGEIMDETYFYFVDEIGEPEHYIGCRLQYSKPYWAGLCDIPDGTEFLTAEELVNAKIYRGKSLKERWNDVRIICMGGIPLDDYMRMCN